jgi:hypothetical protein
LFFVCFLFVKIQYLQQCKKCINKDDDCNNKVKSSRFFLGNHIPFLFHFADMDDVQLDSVLAVDTPVATAQPPPPASSTRRDAFSTVPWDQVTWEHVSENADGRASAVCGVLLSSMTTKILRVICGRLAIRGVKNTKKTELVDKVVTNYSNWKAYKRFAHQREGTPTSTTPPSRSMTPTIPAITTTPPAPRKEIQCSFRLMNILFSDEFAADFAELGNTADRNLLDNGMAGNEAGFWVGVQSAFVEPHPDYDELRFMDDDVMASQDTIDPGKIINHDWKKLRKIWKGVNAEYKAALTRFTTSGTHEQRFYDFCYGKVDTYYLRKNLEARPHLNDTVVADLPDECAISSDIIPSTITGASSSKKPRRAKDNKNDQMLASAIQSFADQKSGAKVFEVRVDCMLKDEARREKEELRREKDDKRRDNDEQRKDNDDRRRERKERLDEWERIQKNLQNLRQELRNPLLDDNDRTDIQDDIERLRKRKNILAENHLEMN